MSRLHRLVVTVAIALAAHSGLVHAGLINQSQSFSNGSPVVGLNGAGVGINVFNQFDAALGTLDSVDIAIDGVLELNLNSPAHFPDPTNPTALSYPVTTTANLGFVGLHMILDPTVIATGQNQAAATTHFYRYEYSFDLTLDATTDLLGIAPIASLRLFNGIFFSGSAINPPFANLMRADFVTAVPGTPYVIRPEFSLSGIVGAPVLVNGAAISTGGISLTYNFTDAVAVPEPPIAILMLAGLVTAAWPKERGRVYLPRRT